MEYNKEEGERCYHLAEKFWTDDNVANALKFVRKSLRLYHSVEAEVLLEKIQRLHPDVEAKEDSPYDPKTNGNLRHRSACQTEKSKTFTKEQLDAVNRIKQCKDFYEVLGVCTNAVDSEIKKKYKKLAFQFHPDKNRAPGADEAFKGIAMAFSVLSDPSKRAQYDLRASCINGHYNAGFGEKYDDEVFEQFFNARFHDSYNGVDDATAHTFRRHRTARVDDSTYALVMQVSPLLVLMVFLCVIMFLVGDHPYSFHKTPKYTQERTTPYLQISYYVKKDFHQHYEGTSLKGLEKDIELVYIQSLQDACNKETIYKKHLQYTDTSRAAEFTTPNCDKLTELNVHS